MFFLQASNYPRRQGIGKAEGYEKYGSHRLYMGQRGFIIRFHQCALHLYLRLQAKLWLGTKSSPEGKGTFFYSSPKGETVVGNKIFA